MIPIIFLFFCSAAAVVHAVDNNCSTLPPTCETTWTNVRQSVPTLCDSTCWSDLESAFIRRHPTCKGVVKDSCARRLPETCDVACRTRFAEKNGDCRSVLEGTCYEKHGVYARQGRVDLYTNSMEILLNAMSPILIIGKIMYLAGRLDRIRVSGRIVVFW